MLGPRFGIDAEAFARQAVQEVAGDRFARREADGMHEAVETLGPGGLEAFGQRGDLFVGADVAVEDQFRAEFGGVFRDALLEALTDIAEGEFGAFPVAGARDAVGDRAVVQNARDEQAFAGEESHAVSVCC